MASLTASVRLRPVRIGFLVNPNDMKSVRQIMRSAACLWGGCYNPMIPVSRSQPKIWREKHFRTPTGTEVARGYTRFFEPDVFVEAEPGLANAIGLTGLGGPLRYEVTSLNEFMSPEKGRSWGEPRFGLPVSDVLRNRYQEEQQFLRREPRLALILEPSNADAAAEAIFGAYPSSKPLEHFREGYVSVYRPTVVPWTPETWLNLYRDFAIAPLGAANHGLDRRRFWHHEPKIFVFDPTNAPDVIDMWNLRSEPSPIIPIPLAWISALTPFLQGLITDHYRPLEGNDNGVMHEITIEFARSIAEADAIQMARAISEGVPAGSLLTKLWRSPIWQERRDGTGSTQSRMRITAAEGDANLNIDGADNRRASFTPLTPAFASDYGSGQARWVNVLSIASYSTDDVCTVIPFNTFDRSWPRLRFVGGESTLVTSEGWVFRGTYRTQRETLDLPTMAEIVHGALKRVGIEASLSEPGRIAKQMLQRLGGLWGAFVLRDRETLKLLNRMAGSVRRRTSQSEGIEETFAGRTAALLDWEKLIRERNKRDLGTRSLEDFTGKDVIRVGLDTGCPHCAHRNWSGLDLVDYQLTCERCLNAYPFPQGQIARKSENFRYRVVGPFAIPDYGRGAYSTLLTLAAVSGIGDPYDNMTFATASDLKIGERRVEADFLAIKRDHFNESNSPDFIIGECKSFGEGELIRDEDLAKLRLICSKIPGSIVVISVLRDSFTAAEKAKLLKFTKWAGRSDALGQATNPVVLLTGVELFAMGGIGSNWQKLGEPYAALDHFQSTKDLRSLAKATQKIHLRSPVES